MTPKQNSRHSEEEVLLAFSVEPTHDRKTLEFYLREYPEHAQALISCSIGLMLNVLPTEDIEVTSGAAIDRAWQHFQQVVSLPTEGSVVNPFVMLNPSSFKLLAKKLDINNLFLTRLRDRAIDATTIPQRFAQLLATELGSTIDVIMTYLRNPPAMVSRQSFRSDVKPEVAEQISFTKAVETSQLTQAQQDALKAMQE